MNLRIGQGQDFHPLVEGRPLVLGGVEIPFQLGLAGYSDADALIHAIIDALLGAVALGDIGKHYPPSDLQYKNISSLVLLRRTGKKLEEGGWQIENIDSTVVAPEPKLEPFIDRMRGKVAEALRLHPEQVSIKAKTAEAPAFSRIPGISAYAVALVSPLAKKYNQSEVI